MRRISKWIFYLFSVPFLFVLSHFLIGSTAYGKTNSTRHQIRYIDAEMQNGADITLQGRYPEGYLFSNALFAIGILNHAAYDTREDDYYREVVERCIDKILSEDGKSNFSERQSPPYGVFYIGWTNYVLKKFLHHRLASDSSKRSAYETAYANNVQRIKEAQSNGIKVLDSYIGANWPADNMVAIASLPDSNLKLKLEWVQKLRATSTSDIGLIHHDGYDTNKIRGSSSAMILYFMSEIDSTLAIQQNKVFLDQFSTSLLGTQLIRECKEGDCEDSDSGPVLYSYGSSATVMNIITQAKLGNKSSHSTWRNMNAVSLPITWNGQKYYLWEYEMMYDIFMLWAVSEIGVFSNNESSLKQ